MKTTFLNAGSDKPKRTELRKAGRAHLESRAEDFKFFMEYGTEPDEAENNFNWWAKEAGEEPEDYTHNGKTLADVLDYYRNNSGSFYDYGLSVDYVAPGTFDKQKEGYLRYQISYGGPSEEIRFYFTPNAREAYKIEFVYLDWGVGVGFDVTNEDWARWLFDWFNESGTVQAEVQKAFDNE